MLRRTFFLLAILHVNLFHVFSGESTCLNNGNYTRNSTYAENLIAALSSIPDNIDGTTGFYNASVGQGQDRANAVALCRGDVQPEFCRGCIRNITSDVLEACPNQRQAFQWSEFCTLRYSNETLYGTRGPSRPAGHRWNNQNATNPVLFMEEVRTLLNSLRRQAAQGGARRKVAAANVTATGFQIIYGLVQCTPDLSADDCSQCLIGATGEIPTCCDRRRAGIVWWPSCNLRYATYSFYNLTRLSELEPPPAAPQSLPSTPAAPQPPPPGTNGGSNMTTAIASVASVVVGVALCQLTEFVISRKRTNQKPEEQHETDDEISNMTESLKFSISAIRAATNDFSNDNKLGQGGFGIVYKGILPNDQEIAVKRLSENSGQGDVEFKNEVVLLAQLQHQNLVRLLGFCLGGGEKLLVYEFVQNSSLDHFIFDPIKRSYLDWEKRYKIIGGIARGIFYLHEDSQLRIIHRDLKPNNVLLDGSMSPKIADFGLARLFEQDKTHESTSRVAGTFGYIAPEYVIRGHYSVKSDVFSFGVLLLEIISGQKNKCIRRGESEEDLLSFAWKNWNDSTATNFIDPCLKFGSGMISEMLRCIHIGLLCVQEDPTERPTMASVIVMLNNISITLAAPSEPAFYPSNAPPPQENHTRESRLGSSSRGSMPPIQRDDSSRNHASITDLYAR